MSTDMMAGTLLMRDGTFLPKTLLIQSAPYCEAWRELKGIDTYTLDREARSSGWNLFFVAGELRTSVFGESKASVRRGTERLANRVSSSHFNCVQIGRILRRRFLGIPYLSFSAYAFHIQDNRSLGVSLAAPVSLVTRMFRRLW